MRETELRHLLAGGDRRSIGAADAVAARIAGSPAGIAAAVALMRDADPVIVMRAADALEKATRADPEGLAPHKGALLGDIARDGRQEIRWHLLQVLPRLPLDPAERARAFALARGSLGHESRIVVADALSALFALSVDDTALRVQAVQQAERLLGSGAAAVRARAGRLLSGR